MKNLIYGAFATLIALLVSFAILDVLSNLVVKRDLVAFVLRPLSFFGVFGANTVAREG